MIQTEHKPKGQLSKSYPFFYGFREISSASAGKLVGMQLNKKFFI
jgi:hypothetical protein